MEKPKQRIGRPGLIAAGVFLVLLAAGLYIQSRRSSHEVATTAKVLAAPEPAPAILPLQPIGRAELITAAADAADAYARGRPTAETSELLMDRRIRLRLAFGCFGEAPESPTAPLSWEYDQKSESLRVTARPENWSNRAWVKALAPDAELIEGFWVERPWMRNAGCPAVQAFVGPTLLQFPRQTLGIAEIFAPGSSRVGRQVDRPYRIVKKMAPEDVHPGGFILVLEGRVDRFTDGRSIACWSSSPDLRPVCLLAADIDHVALQTFDGKQLAEWNN